MVGSLSTKTIIEPSRKNKVCQEADVVVVGGGPGGIASAIAAARSGAETVLIGPTLCIPYRCLVPRKVDGLLVACRAFSSDDSINQHFNIIPHCICYGQAAGTAAAMAAKAGIQPRNVDYKALRGNLVKQGIHLPDVK
jgi:threonine dehydrogenase-like Zn-dependent dehydrogenase